MSSSSLAAVTVFAAIALAPPSARAQQSEASSAQAEGARHVAEGRRLYAELDFPGSVDAMRRALAVPGLPDALRLEAFEYLGSAYVVLEQPEQAQRAFVSMLELDPYHAVREPSGSPKIARFVEELRATIVDDAALDRDARLRPLLPAAGRAGSPTPVQFEAEAGDIASVAVFVRGAAEREYERLETERDGSLYSTEVPARSDADELELYAEARDRERRVVTRAGEPLAPLLLSIRPAGRADDGGDFLTQWWFWVGVGVLVAGGVAIGLAVSVGENAPAGTLPPGRVELP